MQGIGAAFVTINGVANGAHGHGYEQFSEKDVAAKRARPRAQRARTIRRGLHILYGVNFPGNGILGILGHGRRVLTCHGKVPTQCADCLVTCRALLSLVPEIPRGIFERDDEFAFAVITKAKGESGHHNFYFFRWELRGNFFYKRDG